jgi:hypothetical protein
MQSSACNVALITNDRYAGKSHRAAELTGLGLTKAATGRLCFGQKARAHWVAVLRAVAPCSLRYDQVRAWLSRAIYPALDVANLETGLNSRHRISDVKIGLEVPSTAERNCLVRQVQTVYNAIA